MFSLVKVMKTVNLVKTSVAPDYLGNLAGGIRWVRNDAGLGVLKAARPRPLWSPRRASALRRSKYRGDGASGAG